MSCLLCGHKSSNYFDKYFQCSNCGLVFKNQIDFLDANSEFSRYQHHHNDIFDDGYVNFLSKLISPLESKFNEIKMHLDFGSGVRSYYSEFFLKMGIQSNIYDLYFYPDKKSLAVQYDLVTCSEVVEHFQNPSLSWEELNSIVKPGGYLAIMTSFFHGEIDFNSWWYKNDPTHVVFYGPKTFDYLKEKYKYEEYYCDNKSVIIFRKKGI